MPSRFNRHCCSELKEYKICDRAIQGIRREESTKRAALYKEPERCRFYGKGVPAYAPIITGDGEIDFATVDEVWGAPAIFEDPSLAIEFGTAFESFYWELYNE